MFSILGRVPTITVVALAATLCSAQVQLNSSASPSQGQAGLNLIIVTGSGFPSGTIPPANVTVFLTPAGTSGPSVTTRATAVQTIVGSTRRVQFRIPAALAATTTITYLVSIAGTTSASVSFSSKNTASLQIIPAPVISLTPNSGQAGSTVTVQIGVTNTAAGANAGFVQGSTVAGFGTNTSVGGAAPGVLGPVTVTNQNSATAQLTISATSAAGTQKVLVETGSEEIYSTFSITPPPPARLAFTEQPQNITSGQMLPAVQVSVEDSFGNVISSANGPIQVGLASNPGNDALGGIVTQTAISGVATFSGLTLKNSGVGYALAASGLGLATVSNPFTVNAAQAVQLIFTSEPGDATPGQSLGSVKVGIEDTNGNLIGSPNLVTIAMGTNPGGGALAGTLTQSAVSGIATFPDLSINAAGEGYTLVASAEGLNAISTQFKIRVPPELASCLPSSSLGVLLPRSGRGSVTAYAPNGSWSNGAMGIEVVPIEGEGIPAVISTPNPVNSCASNSVTGETACVANNTDVYLVSGSNLNSTLTSSGSGVTVQFDPPTVPSVAAKPEKAPLLSGGWCLNCGIAVNGFTNTAVIEMGFTSGLPPFYSALQFLNLGNNTFSPPFPLANNISEDVQWDSIHNLILSPSEYQFGDVGPDAGGFNNLAGGNYDLIDTSSSTPTEFGRLLPYANLDAAAEDCTTGIALSGLEGDVPPPFQSPASRGLFISDLTQAAFTTGSPGSWTAPGQFVAFPEFYYLGYVGGGTAGVAVPPGSHLAVVTGEEAGDQLAVVELPSISGNGTPIFEDYAAAELPRTPDGQSWSQGFDPHPITAYVSPNTGRPMAIFANTSQFMPPTWLAVIDLQGLLDAPRVSGVFPGGISSDISCTNCTHTVDPAYDLIAHNVVRYVGTAPHIASACSTTGQRGQQGQQIALTGLHTQWIQNVTSADFGAGITVESLSVGDATHATAVIDIDPAANLGPRVVTTVTGNEVATTDNPYVIAALASVAPSSGQQGQQNLSVTLTGQFSNWVNGSPRGSVTQLNFGAGITVLSVAVNSPTSLTATLNIDPSAPVGPRSVTITNPVTGCDAQVFTSAFSVTAGAMIVESLSPNYGQKGQQNISVALIGNGTNWVNGTTTADFGPEITVTSVSVKTPTSATAMLNINPNAVDGAQTVTVATGSEVETRVNGFVVASTLNPLILIEPNSGQQGQQNISMLIADTFGTTYWVPGLSTVSFGPDITVTSLTVNTAGSISAMLNISPTATPGLRDLTVTTGSEVDTLSNGFTVTSGTNSIGPPVKLAFVGQPTNTAAGQPISAVRVAVEDVFGNVVTSAPGIISVAIASGPVSGTLLGTTSQPAINGVATFSDLNIRKSGSYILMPSLSGLSSEISTAFAITPGPPTQLAFSTTPSEATAGQPTSVQVAVEDTFNNVVSAASNPVSIALATNPGSATLGGATTVAPSAGIAVFSVSINKIGSGYSFTASSPSLPSALSTTFAVNPGAPSQIVFLTRPGSFTLNAAMAPVQVAIEDSVGDVLSGITRDAVTLGLSQNPSGASLLGTISVPFANGVANFAGLTISKVGTGYVLLASGLGFTALSNPFNVITNIPTPTSIQVSFSDPVVAPGGRTTITQIVLDQYGNAMISPSFQFTIGVAAKGATFGNVPVLNGNAVQFPALIKKKIIVDPSIFSDGDTDPADPNYGKETGGTYTVTVSLQGSSVSGSADVLVLPSGTAFTTVEVHQYANKLDAVLTEGSAALQAQDPVGISHTINDLATVKSNNDYSFNTLRLNNAMAPPDGLMVTANMLSAAGLQSGPDDNAFGSSLADLVNQTAQFSARLAQVNPSAITQADLDALQTMLNNYQSLSQQFAGLHPSAVGTVQQSTNINLMMTYAMPQLMDTVSTQFAAVLQQLSTSQTADGNSIDRSLVSPAILRWTGRQHHWRTSSQSSHAVHLQKAQFDQLITFVDTLVNIARDFNGAAKHNIFYLTVSLLNSLLNIEIAQLVNSLSSGGVSIDIVNASSSLTFACPAYSGTNINAFGCSSTAGSNVVVLIGCVDPDALKTAFTFSPGKSLYSKYKWLKDEKEAVDSLLAIVSVLSPDTIEAGIFSEQGELQLDFANGWPPVNQSKIPCVGTIILLNQETGDFTAVNSDFVGSCDTGN